MNESHNSNIQKENNNIILSKGAINFLDNQILKNGESKIIEKEFIFQVIDTIKKLENSYFCSLMDQNSKYGGFCINYESQYGEPKKGDIIQTKKIIIVKLEKRDTNLIFCENVKKLNESKKMIIDPNNLVSISKKRSSSKKEWINNNNELKNLKGKKNNIFNSSQISPSQGFNSNLNNSNKKSIKNESNQKDKIKLKKYTLLSNLNNFTNNPIFLLKCRFKSTVKVITSKNKNFSDKVQNYIFYDIKGEEIQAVSFKEWADKFDEIIKVGSIYEISRIKKTINRKEFKLTKNDFQLNFGKGTKIEEIEDQEYFKNTKINESFTPISKLTDDKVNKFIHSIVGIILEDKGIIEKRKENGEIIKLRIIIIGDNTLHKINIKLWEEKLYPEKKYLKGDIVYVYNFKYKKYYNTYDLNSISLSEIQLCEDEIKKKELKNFYNKHRNIYEYKDINFSILNSLNNIENKFIIDFKDDCILQYDENNNEELIKINGTIINLNLNEYNIYEGCIFCNKNFEEECPLCLNRKKKLIFLFNVKISDCSDYLWIEFFGDIGENYLGISPENYQKMINNNDINGLNKIKERILYNKYTFIGKFKGTFYEECVIFSVVQFNKNDKEYYKELIKKLKVVNN